MVNFIANAIATLVTLPVVATIIIYFVLSKWSDNKWKAVHRTVNVSTPLFILAVATLLHVIFGNAQIGYICITIILVVIGVIFIQWKITGEIEFLSVWKRSWRFTFLLFSFFYIILFFIGIARSIIKM